MSVDRLDVVIFGATGFTGKHAVLEAIKILGGMSWGIAGRNEKKLLDVLSYVSEKSQVDLSHIPVIIADITNDESLVRMAERAKIVVNCCGPYRFYGEPVVKACINAGAHHVDVSGEPQFIERMQLEYNDLAKEKGVFIVSACGFDSIPCDVGLQFFEKHFDGEVHAVETYLKSWTEGKVTWPAIHYGTWESAVYGLAHYDELKGLRKKLFKEPLSHSAPKQKRRPIVHKSDLVNAWCLPFVGSDRSVALRSQRFLYEHEKKPPVQIQTYVQFKSLLHVIILTILGSVFGLLAKFEFGRQLLLKYPQIFSLGFFSHEGPSEETMRNTKFSITFYGDGWPKGETGENRSSTPTKNLITRVSASDPGYGATCVALLLSAKTILTEKAKLPGNGGVLPPGACFAKTDIISNLSKNGFNFEVISAQETDSKKTE